MSGNKLPDRNVAAGRKPSGFATPDGLRRSAKSVINFRTSPKSFSGKEDWGSQCRHTSLALRVGVALPQFLRNLAVPATTRIDNHLKLMGLRVSYHSSSSLTE